MTQIKHKDKFPIITKIINHNPTLFNNSVVIGIDKGNDICNSLMIAAHQLSNIKFYENFATIFPEHIPEYKELYQNYTKYIPNLEILLEDGANYDDVPDFLCFGSFLSNIELALTNLAYTKTLFCSEGFGQAVGSTIRLSELAAAKKLFPVFLDDHNMFFTIDDEICNIYQQKILNTLKTNNIDSFISGSCIRPKTKWHIAHNY